MPKERGGGTVSSSGAPKGITKAFAFWQDREVHFGAMTPVLDLRVNTEHVYATFNNVEDVKSNKGHSGTLLVTNLRLIWWSSQRKTVNLSIGYYCVQKLTVQEATSKLAGGTTECITLSVKLGTSRFQFLFSVAHRGSDSDGSLRGGKAEFSHARRSNDTAAHRRLYATIHAVWSAYQGTLVYRELRVRSAVVQQGKLVLLDGEKVISRTVGVNSVSKDEGHLGTFIVTNIRVVWFGAAESFNVSVPYLQFVGLSTQMSRFGRTLVVEASKYAGNFVLGFRIDPEEKLDELYAEISTMWRTWTARPLLGMRVTLLDDTATAIAPGTLGVEGGHGEPPRLVGLLDASGSGVCERQIEGQNVLQEAPADAFAAYYADEGQKGADRRPVYEPSIGLAIEKLRKGATIQSLWDTSVPPG
ncbi:hypothetical protein JKF63_07515 [Porcisia hertigi]|uniref:BBSome complex member BBS5 PH domain-containing protein n=1 Tax=Porcisia hertigi TaxID=2761500 RepID=A0A836LHA4_9TRYP|nr:hypothetical protein JKF63_07515 [Porcisia hertigi]